MPRKKKEKILDNQESIKRLLILLLFTHGVGVEAIADALEIGISTVSRMVPQTNLKKQK